MASNQSPAEREHSAQTAHTSPSPNITPQVTGYQFRNKLYIIFCARGIAYTTFIFKQRMGCRWSSRQYALQEAPSAEAAGPPPQGPETARQRAVRRWRQAAQYVLRILRLRRKWAAVGRHLQLGRIRDLVAGVERRGGQLRRVAAAPTPAR